jgi:hypothetical protein
MRIAACILILALLTGCLAVPYPHTSVRLQEISGTVLEAHTHTPISGADIFLAEHPQYSCKSDSAGRFRLKTIHNWHFATIYGAGGESEWPVEESWSCIITIRHANYRPLTLDLHGQDYFFLTKLGEPPKLRPWLVFRGNGQILQDSGAAQYVRPGDIYVHWLDAKTSRLHIGFVQRVHELRVTALNDPQETLVLIPSEGGDFGWDFSISYWHSTPEAQNLKGSSLVYTLEFIP